VKKAKLLSTVAAVLLMSAGAASAQGMNKEAPQQAPAAQQNAPAEKVAPSIEGGEHKAPQTTGQAAPDAKSAKPRETTGQSPKSDADDKASTHNRAMDKHETTGQSPKSGADDKASSQNRAMDKDKATDKDKSGAAASGKSDVRSKSEENGASSRSSQTTTEQNRTTTGQGAAAGSAKLTTEQRTKITTVIRQQKVEPAHLNVSVSVGTRIPTSVHVYPLPVEVIAVYPDWRGYDYILVGDQIVIINPRTHEIVAIVEA
jgi:hypothetical protein